MAELEDRSEFSTEVRDQKSEVKGRPIPFSLISDF